MVGLQRTNGAEGVEDTVDNERVNGSPDLLHGQVTRRRLLAGAAALASGPVLISAPLTRAAGAAEPSSDGAGSRPGTGTATAGCPWRHAVGEPRGSDIAVAVGRNREGRFGLMFKDLDAFTPADDLLRDLADEMVDPEGPRLDNEGVPAGFTFLGQFIDHDMTFDRTPLSEQRVDPHGLVNFDTPHFDLGSVYGRGPDEDPQLYDPARPGRLLLVEPNGIPDLPRRTDGTAFVGDVRNDENLIVAQLHIAFIRFHNRLVNEGATFTGAQRTTRWHFQWLIVHDFLERIVGRELVERFLVQRGGAPPIVRREFYKPKNPHRPMMPVEYSVAAFRFGHSMVRSGYLMNDGAGGPIFGNPNIDLHGSRPIPARLRIDWKQFFEMRGRASPPGNLARRIDGKLSIPLFNLPEQIVPTTPQPVITSLAERNLLRGKRLGLPAGQDVARRMGATPISNEELGLSDAGWGGKAPLWFYVLKEAELQQDGRRLGDIGGRIVAETILGILASDQDSYLHARGGFQPAIPDFRTGDLLAFAEDG